MEPPFNCPLAVTGKTITRVEEELGRGEAVGVVWAIAGG